MLFVTIFGPMMKRMNRKLHFPRPLSAIVLLILATLLLAVLLWVLSSWVLGSLPVWIRSMDAREQEWLAMVRDLCHGVGEIIGVDASYLENTVSGRLQEGLDSLEENILPGMLSQSMQYVRWFAEVGGFLVTFLIASVLLAKDYDGIMNHLLDQESCHVLLEVICGIVRYIATFVKAQGIIMSAIALTAAITLGIAGISMECCGGSWRGFWMRCLLLARGWCCCHWESGSYWREASVERLSVVRCMWYVFSCGRYWSPVSSAGNRSVSHCCIGVAVCRDPAVRRLGDHQGTVGICADLRDVS